MFRISFQSRTGEFTNFNNVTFLKQSSVTEVTFYYLEQKDENTWVSRKGVYDIELYTLRVYSYDMRDRNNPSSGSVPPSQPDGTWKSRLSG